ncbi:MAG: hypothetical protein QOI50_2182, partial [Pseudonocardiales bacterium]|nr:hypothetical protein [Pseudonocardiales bacterium]
MEHQFLGALLMIVGRDDGLTGGNLAASAYGTAAEPKKIIFPARRSLR